MSLSRIKGILLQEFFITRKSLEVIMDIFFFSLMSILVFGFVTTFLAGNVNKTAAHYLILGIILWEIIRINQYSMSVGSLWNIWSRNLSNMFISPLTLREFIFAHMLSGVFKAGFVFILISILSTYVFNFNILNIGFFNLLLIFINLTIFSWSVGIIILGFIFKQGTRIQALAWGLIFIFQPLTAAFFPLNILPVQIQTISRLLPPTYVFESARSYLQNPATNWELTLIAFVLNIIYFILSLLFFNFLFNKSKETGQFARNEG